MTSSGAAADAARSDVRELIGAKSAEAARFILRAIDRELDRA